jgi:uncharacterized protein (DUF58 family)
VGLLRPLLPLTLIGLALLLWFCAEWLLFAVRLPGLRGLYVERELWDDKAPVSSLWAGRSFEVRVRLGLDGWMASPFVDAADLVPFGVEHLDGLISTQGEVSARRPLELRYRTGCRTAGLARFEGLRVQVADAQGFFYHATFVRAPVVLRVLPGLVRRPGQSAAKKRHNLLMPPGIHRHRRPGSGSELLDLRDYLPGDPPRTIAWKVSARRDRLITKEFESEVPVRCTLFVDTSNSVRVPAASGARGRPAHYGKALDRLVDIAAAILQASHAIRDPTGLCLFDEEEATSVRPDRSGRHLTGMLNLLADAAALTPRTVRAEPERLLGLAYSFAQEVYPELMRPAVNAMPFWQTWLGGFSGRVRRRLGPLELLHRRKEELLGLCWWASFWSLLLPGLLFLAGLLFKLRALAEAAMVAVIVLSSVSVFLWQTALLLMAFDTLVGRGKRRRERWRKQLAALLSVRYGLAPGGLGALLEDDDAFALLVQRFLTEHQVPYSLALYDRAGRYLFAAPPKVSVLADALLRAVGKGHDNELFVLLADLLELDDRLQPLLAAVRVALGRHHQVVLICPWPPGLPLPHDNPAREAAATLAVHGRPTGADRADKEKDQADVWGEATTQRFHAAYQRLRRTFTRLGVSVICAAGDEPVPLILDRLERLRMVGRPHS